MPFQVCLHICTVAGLMRCTASKKSAALFYFYLIILTCALIPAEHLRPAGHMEYLIYVFDMKLYCGFGDKEVVGDSLIAFAVQKFLQHLTLSYRERGILWLGLEIVDNHAGNVHVHGRTAFMNLMNVG